MKEARAIGYAATTLGVYAGWVLAAAGLVGAGLAAFVTDAWSLSNAFMLAIVGIACSMLCTVARGAIVSMHNKSVAARSEPSNPG